jgi:uncharacterized protein (DUF952 family)
MHNKIVTSAVDRIRFGLWGSKPTGPQVFGIGLAKTGTVSLTDALTILGYNAIHYSPCFRISQNVPVFAWPWWLNRYNAHSDVPIAYFFKQIDQRFPDSKFILTTRPETQWLDSCKRHFTERREELDSQNKQFRPAKILDRTIYGSSVFDETKFLTTYQSHTRTVCDHFKKSNNLLIIDIADKSMDEKTKWGRLCEFLEKTVPDAPFPHSNVYDKLAAHAVSS